MELTYCRATTQYKIKVAGTEGSFDTLSTKARFEEAKLRELVKSELVPSKRQGL